MAGIKCAAGKVSVDPQPVGQGCRQGGWRQTNVSRLENSRPEFINGRSDHVDPNHLSIYRRRAAMGAAIGAGSVSLGTK